MTKKSMLLAVLWLLWAGATRAQGEQPFAGRFYNEELKIQLVIDLYGKEIHVPGQDVFGAVDGYLQSKQGSGVWLIVASEVEKQTATLSVINDYGSEDFTATLKCNADGTLTLRHQKGSTLKFAVDRKWQKIPATVTFTPSRPEKSSQSRRNSGYTPGT